MRRLHVFRRSCVFGTPLLAGVGEQQARPEICAFVRTGERRECRWETGRESHDWRGRRLWAGVPICALRGSMNLYNRRQIQSARVDNRTSPTNWHLTVDLQSITSKTLIQLKKIANSTELREDRLVDEATALNALSRKR